jgi:hypothetical protein
MTPAERAAAFERILHSALPVLADPDSPAEAVTQARKSLAEITRLIDALHGIRRQHDTRFPETVPPHDARTRARKADGTQQPTSDDRGAEGLHGLRKGRRQCEATTRDGRRCKAPALVGGSVCRVHGGSAPQIRLRAAMFQLYEARYKAGEEWQAKRGTPGEFDALCALSGAENAVNRAEEKMDRVRELRAELRRRKTAE